MSEAVERTYQRPLFSRRSAIAQALQAAGLRLPWVPLPEHPKMEADLLQHEAAARFDKALWEQGYEVIRRPEVKP